MSHHYLLRLDDACPYMDSQKWQRMESMLDKHGVKPLVGIIPANADRGTMVEPEDNCFWEKVREWEKKGWCMALHGYDHVYRSNDGMKGLNPMWRRSEFAGVSLEVQREKIRKGVAVFREKGIEPKCFFAPSHTFDNNTLEALRLESNIRIVSDTIGRWPYRQHGFLFVPQIAGHCMKMPLSGIYTFCYHPNMMDGENFSKLEAFLSLYAGQFVSFEAATSQIYGPKTMTDRLISWLYFFRRKLC